MKAPHCLLCGWLAVLVVNASLHAGRDDFDFGKGLPLRKHPVDVVLRRNPFQLAVEPERPLPVLRDRDDPASKLPGLISGKIRSVIRQPKPLLLLEGNVIQPGDEVRFGSTQVLPNHRVVLKAIDDDRLIFHVTSLDPQQPGQVEVAVLLGPGMRRTG